MKFLLNIANIKLSKVEFICNGHHNREINKMQKIKPCRLVITLPVDNIQYKNKYHGYDVLNDSYSFCVKCPNCGAYTELNSKKIPESVKHYINAKLTTKTSNNNQDYCL